MLLFSALLPPAEVVESVRLELDRLGARECDEVRWSPPERWHITLGFYGDHADPVTQRGLLARQLAGYTAPRVSLAGAGVFPGVLWLAVEGQGLSELAAAAGAGRDGRAYRPHLTLGRWSREYAGVADRWVRRLAGFRCEPWSAAEAVLMSGDPGEAGARYRVVQSFALGCGRRG